MAQLHIEPYPKQVEFFKAQARYIAYGGARGGGKSWSARTKAVLLALSYDGMQILLLRRTLMELRENHVLPLLQQLQGIAKYNGEAKEFTFPNSSRIKLGYCAAESDVLQYQGQAYDVMFLEEATQFTEFQKDTLTESNRSSGMMKERFTPRMYFTANPGGVGHGWFKRLFVDQQYRQSEKAENYTFIPSTVYDNHFLMTNNPEYVENLENLPEMRKRAMLYGDWDAFEGQYFPEFSREIHVVEPFVIPAHWTRYRSLDYGLDMLACLWYAVDPHNNVYVYKELHESNHIISQAAKRIAEVNGEDKITQTYAPGDLWNRRQDTGKSAADIFGEGGIGFYKSSQNRIQGWYSIKEAIAVTESQDEQTGAPIKTAKLRIFNNCHRLISNLPQIQQSERDPNDCANEPHDITHICDALRYFCVMRFNKFRSAEPEQDPDKWTHDKQVHKTYASGRNANKLAKWG